MRCEIRGARPDDAAALSALALRAKAHWGYPDAWLRLWEKDLTITAEYLAAHSGFVAVDSGTAVGMCVLAFGSATASLEHVWVEPARQGLGVGRSLVVHALEAAVRAGAGSVSVLSDPYAEAFYLRLGARRVGSVPAPMPDAPERELPRLEFTLVAPEDPLTRRLSAARHASGRRAGTASAAPGESRRAPGE